MITPEDVCLLLPWAFATIQISCLCFPFLFSLSAVAFGIHAEANVSHFSKLECCCGLFFEPLPASSWCSSVRREGVCPKNSQHFRASKHFPGVFVHLYFKFVCQKVDIVCTESKMLLLVCHVSLRVKNFKSWCKGILSYWYQSRLNSDVVCFFVCWVFLVLFVFGFWCLFILFSRQTHQYS